MSQFLRRVELTIFENSADISYKVKDLRVAFDIHKTLSSETNKSTISVYNFSADTRYELSQINPEAALAPEIELKARYVNLPFSNTPPYLVDSAYDDRKAPYPFEVVFFGNLLSVEHQYSGVDIITKFECGDGDALSHNSKISVNYSDKKAKTVKQVMADVIAKARWPQAREIGSVRVADKQLTTGYNFTGLVAHCLDELANMINVYWYFRDGVVHYYSDLEKETDRPQASSGGVIYLDETTGLIGRPEEFFETGSKLNVGDHLEEGSVQTDRGYNITALLQPKANPGELVQVKSSVIKRDSKYPSQFTINEVKHEGDTHDNPWYTKMKVVR